MPAAGAPVSLPYLRRAQRTPAASLVCASRCHIFRPGGLARRARRARHRTVRASQARHARARARLRLLDTVRLRGALRAIGLCRLTRRHEKVPTGQARHTALLEAPSSDENLLLDISKLGRQSPKRAKRPGRAQRALLLRAAPSSVCTVPCGQSWHPESSDVAPKTSLPCMPAGQVRRSLRSSARAATSTSPRGRARRRRETPRRLPPKMPRGALGAMRRIG